MYVFPLNSYRRIEAGKCTLTSKILGFLVNRRVGCSRMKTFNDAPHVDVAFS
jgi:hypothetical protein